MGARRGRGLSADEAAVLRGKVADVEARLKALEASVRALRARRAGGAEAADVAPAPRRRRRPRCPGCTLELPKGHRGVECVWCGFRLDALEAFPQLNS